MVEATATITAAVLGVSMSQQQSEAAGMGLDLSRRDKRRGPHLLWQLHCRLKLTGKLRYAHVCAGSVVIFVSEAPMNGVSRSLSCDPF